MAEDSVLVRCGKCDTRNRVPAGRLKDRPVCGKCRAPLAVASFSGKPMEISDGTFAREVLSHPAPVLVDCWAPWCGPCRMVAPVLEELASEYAGRLKIAKLNVDENPATASRYGIQSIPTMLLFNQGSQVDRLVGALPKQEIVRHLQAVL